MKFLILCINKKRVEGVNEKGTMVRVGEFSPLNPNLNSGRPLLGLGEYEERRKALLEQKKREYFHSMEQARLLAKSGQITGKRAIEKNTDFIMFPPREITWRTVSTQTDIQEVQQNLPYITAGVQTEITGSPRGCDTNYNEEVKQVLYREELRKQIEEKQKLEAMKREKEKLEEALLEARVQKQQEEMMKQYEEELTRRTAIQQKKREQEEALHQRLAEMQQEAIEYREKLWRQRQQELKLKISGQAEETSESTSLDYGKKLKTRDSKDLLTEKGNGVQNEASLNFSSEQIKPVSHVEQKNDGYISISPGHDLPAALPKSSNFPTHLISRNVDTEKVPFEHKLLEEKTHMINQNIRDAIPLIPQNTPRITVSSPIPAVVHRQRTNSETLDDKWQVPVVEKYVCSPLEKNSKHNGRVLTQLGAFRKQLQQERLLLQQKICQSRNSS